MIHWYIADRQQGKTHDLITWVMGGSKVDYCPGWDRIILVSSRLEADRLRDDVLLDRNQIFTLDEWKEASGIRGPVQIGIDNVEYFLNRLLFNTAGTIARATANGTTRAWPEVINRRLEEDR